MLEHVQEHVGREYAKALAREPDWGAIRTICHDNDRLGNAEKFFIYPFGMVSPTTLRYLHHAVLVLKRLKTAGHSKVSIVEIGGGYGGLAYVFRRLAAHREVEVLSYTIIDLPEPRRLQQAYLQEVMGSLACYFWKAPEEASTLKYPPGEIVCCISAYALSELSMEQQAQYSKAILQRAHCGSFAWNNVPWYQVCGPNCVYIEEDEAIALMMWFHHSTSCHGNNTCENCPYL